MFSHSFQELPLPFRRGAVVMEPRLEPSVMEPFVMITRSSSPISMTSGTPCRSTCIFVTVMPSPSLKSRSVTVHFRVKSTPKGSRYL
ncbi:hypothetical protein D3C81_2033830 [compost metagenome]